MELTFNSGGSAKKLKCPTCKSKYLQLNRYILDRGEPFAKCIIEAHRHSDEPEAYFTCIIGGWDNEDTSNNLTFSCRYGRVEGQTHYACTLIDVPETFKDPLATRRLTRSEGLAHKKIHEFWHVVDFLLEYDLAIHDYFYHPKKSKLKSIFSR